MLGAIQTAIIKRSVDDFCQDAQFYTLTDIELVVGSALNENGQVICSGHGQPCSYLAYYQGRTVLACDEKELNFLLINGAYAKIHEKFVESLKTFKVDKTYSS